MSKTLLYYGTEGLREYLAADAKKENNIMLAKLGVLLQLTSMNDGSEPAYPLPTQLLAISTSLLIYIHTINKRKMVS